MLRYQLFNFFVKRRKRYFRVRFIKRIHHCLHIDFVKFVEETFDRIFPKLFSVQKQKLVVACSQKCWHNLILVFVNFLQVNVLSSEHVFLHKVEGRMQNEFIHVRVLRVNWDNGLLINWEIVFGNYCEHN